MRNCGSVICFSQTISHATTSAAIIDSHQHLHRGFRAPGLMQGHATPLIVRRRAATVYNVILERVRAKGTLFHVYESPKRAHI
ncbi:hypothetical protein M408DRAFT_95568 [Serendipita vermifera MAFF 305830]|uniref:Uncharacterized protein n=1 Tax=Serendipita vermifera MAFF 305830 TaxID=933852 RepID=A0A0C2X8P9_SERVB|nr:hypothetical protein M408DRAFT_95568 [Serendipita vermifera MAFF 305830]